MPLVSKKPTKEPMPDLMAVLKFCPSINSPIKAPKNGQIIIEIPPKGERITPTNMPIKHPRTPAFVPPNFLVLQTGIR